MTRKKDATDEDKALVGPEEDKAARPVEDKRPSAGADGVVELVTIRFRANRAVRGVGNPGETVQVNRHMADRFVAQGYAEYVKQEG